MLPPHLYVHVPFCARRCSYCDFAIAVRKRTPVDEYLEALDAELELRFADSKSSSLETIYLGGGTPSQLGGEGIERLMDLIRQRATVVPDAEVTIEVNPDDVTAESARAWRGAGINRVSVGGQSFHAETLRWMHRVHDVASISTAFEALRSADLNDISIDLIFSLPDFLGRSWIEDLRQAIALEPTHVSLYGLTIEPNAPLGKWVARREVTEASEDRYAEEFLLADAALGQAGFEHYEVSNFARPERRARHNSGYWRGVPYAGLGPGAHEFDGGRRRWNVRAYSAWVERLRAGLDPLDDSEQLTPENRIAETVYLGLRTTNGLDVAGAELALIKPWLDAGWADLGSEGRLRLTPAGWLRLDSLAATLTHFRSH